EPVQAAVLQRLLPFELVEKLRTCMAGAEQQPVATAGTGRDALLHEAAERCDTSAGADHQDVAAAVDGNAEAFVALDEHRRACTCFTVGEEARGAAATARVALQVVDDGDREMRFVPDHLATRCDRVQARREWTQRGDELLATPSGGM